MKKTLGVILILLSPLPPLLLALNAWFWTSQTLASFVIGTVAYCYFMNSLIMSTRVRFLDRLLGHDAVIRVHILSASTSLVLAIIHRQVNHDDVGEIALFQRLGGLGLLIFIIATVLTMLLMVNSPIKKLRVVAFLRNFAKQRLGLGYGELKNLHNLLIISAILISVHVFLSFPNNAGLAFRVFMALYAAIAVFRWLDFKIFKRLRLRSKNARVTEVRALSNNIMEIWIEHNLRFRPGQFAFLRFPGSALGAEEHPFTISSGSEDGKLSVTVKGIGDYTSKLSNLKRDTIALVDGPYGAFTLDRAKGQNIVFIAGGIGITPFHSMLKYLEASPNARSEYQSITLIWSVKSLSDFIYDSVFKAMEASIPNFRFIPVISDYIPGGDKGGIVSAYNLEEEQPVYYMCGPPPMRKELFKAFKESSIPKNRIVSESFSLGN